MPERYDWAVKFELEARQMRLAGDFKPLVNYEQLGPAAMLSVPTRDHYLPLLYVIATRRQSDNTPFPVEGIDGGSISMLSVCVGSVEATRREFCYEENDISWMLFKRGLRRPRHYSVH